VILRRSAAFTILGIALWASVASAQHGQKPSSGAATAHAPASQEPADRHATPKTTTPAAAPAAASGHASRDTVDTLHDAIARIDEAIAGSRTAHAPKPRAARPTAVAARERVRVKWRIELMWPIELQEITQSSHDRRVVLTWP
jgi:hypothetical protein